MFPTFTDTFNHYGHVFVGNPEQADIILLDLHTRIAEYKQSDIDYVVCSGKPVITFDEFDKGGMSDLDWPDPLTEQQKKVMDYCIYSGVHFCRLLNKTHTYPNNVYPYEKPILYQERKLSADDLFNREYDIVWIANTAPQREILAEALRKEKRLKCNIILGAKKIPYQDWISEHKKGKIYITCSAGGFSNECMQSLFSVSAMLREINDQLLLHPFTHLVNCLETNPIPTEQDLNTIVEVVNNKDKLYEIYLNGFNFVKSFYTEEYIAKDILDKIIKHLT